MTSDAGNAAPRRSRFVARGQVQGVGFRPFVFNLARECRLTGLVRNSPRGVVIEVQGPGRAVDRFASLLESRLPPLARITSLERQDLEPLDREDAFVIAASTASETHAVLISPDMATCADCLEDIRAGRRENYAFTNCTNCGPRYTITRSIPYDRAFTSMACFPMCAACRAEYENPADRRFHAQPNACPRCGPRVWFVQPGKTSGPTGPPFPPPSAPPDSGPDPQPTPAPPTDGAALEALARFLVRGGIAAIKGLGGFHLACDACSEESVALLRQRKNRPHKPFAVMAAGLDQAARLAAVGKHEAELLLSPEHPIVLCPLHDQGRTLLAPGISPDTRRIGIMLPYTPLHALLLAAFARARNSSPLPAVLVMTSGNPGGEPICLGNREALDHLSSMADAFLFHNRDILIRVDDSVVCPLPGRGRLFFRRARGYVPRPVSLTPAGDAPCVLGAGAELKNTLCLTKGDDAFVSQHIGDMANLETAAFHAAMRDHLAGLLAVRPRLVVRDKHPDYLAGRLAGEWASARGIELMDLQHHAAHAQAVLAENNHSGQALVFTLDGAGLGDDHTFWGGELFLTDTGATDRPPGHTRLCTFAPMDLPGGEAAIREPWRIAHALLLRLNLLEDHNPWPDSLAPAARTIALMLRRGLNCPVSTSCGRLFDAAAALLGLCLTTTYEGQAAIRLEEAQGEHEPAGKPYPCPLRPRHPDAGPGSEPDILDTHVLFIALYKDLRQGTPIPVLARRFHESLALALAEAAAAYAQSLGVTRVGLSGGCLQNVTLALRLAGLLEERGLTPLLHKDLPPGDGCISLGQAAWGRTMLLARRGDRTVGDDS